MCKRVITRYKTKARLFAFLFGFPQRYFSVINEAVKQFAEAMSISEAFFLRISFTE